MTQQEISCWLRTWPMRPLPIALAHRFCSVGFGDPRMETLKNIYWSLSVPDRALCKSEFARVVLLEPGANA